MSRKTLYIIFIIVAIIIIFVAGYYYFVLHKTTSSSPQTSNTTSTLWLTYKNDKFQYEIQYPNDAKLEIGKWTTGYPLFTITFLASSSIITDVSKWPIFKNTGEKYSIKFPEGAKLHLPESSRPVYSMDINLKDLIFSLVSLLKIDFNKGNLQEKLFAFNLNLTAYNYKAEANTGNINSAKEWLYEYGQYKYISTPFTTEKEIMINNMSVYYVERPTYLKSTDYINSYYLFWKDGQIIVFSAQTVDPKFFSTNEPLIPYIKKYNEIVKEIIKSFTFI